ncbi:MAG TPA: DUF11 domain-containing protein [Candidatus Limnocylindrales bacterium]|nr:DUF11 domain-containing protein [Candidatus Limnocylindrales bacterium]
MLSRGALGLASPRVRRGLALSWTALFVLSLLLQYAAFAAAPSALAAHNEGIFELDGNALDQGTAGADWQNGPEGASASFFAGAATEAEANDSTYFTGGGSKDENDIPSWAITSNAVPDKDELTDAYGAIYESGGETWFYFGADRFDNDGDAQIGFWFFQRKVGIANGDFTGTHKDGDVLILSEYTNGGVVDLVCAYEWDGSGGGSNIAQPGDCDPATNGSNLNLVAAGAECDVADGTFDICAVTNPDTATAPWTFTNKDGDHDFAAGQFFEGGINLSSMFGGNPPCFATFLAETRSSQETDAQLKDFALGSLSTCVPPTIATQVRQNGQSLGSVGTISLGDTVTDHATFSGSHGAVEGTATFHVCFNASSTPNCGSGGTAAGSDTISGGAADSDPFTPTAAGFYCFRVDYTPTADSEYLAGSHTNQTTECFQVLPANVTIAKTADDGTVNAGDQIGFTLSWGNTGDGKATGVVVTDTLPSEPGLSWHIAGSTGTGSTCAIATGVLTCNVGTIDGNTEVSGTVHIVSDTTEASCGTIDNTGAIESGNDGSGEASASVIVVCPESLFIDKQLADTGATDPDLNVPLAEVGDTLHYTLAYAGAGPITNAVITDVIPEGLEYVDGSAAGDANFTFDSYDPTTRTLTWTAATLPSPASGAVTYDALVLESAPEQPQPLVNVATIVSDRTPPDSDQESVAVLAPPQELTPPPTDLFAPATSTSNPGFTLMLILLAIAGLTIGIGFVTPAPSAATRRPDRRR